MNSNISKIKPWSTVRSEELFKSRWLRLRKDTCVLPSNREIDDFYVVEVPDGAAIVAVTEQNELVLVRQYKHGAGQLVLELPAGIVEMNEEPSITIVRELREETGYLATKIEYVATLITKPARMAAKTLVFFAKNVKRHEAPQINDAEVIETVLLPISELPEYIKTGKLTIDTTLAALLLVWDRLL